MSRYLWTLLAFAALLCIGYAEDTETPQVEDEKECLAAGGICVHISNCPVEKVSAQAKCSKQDFGAVCCHSANPPTETRCEKLHGACKTFCGDNVKLTQAQDCPSDQFCCALV
ncbi:UNVERIFIED_CONTAM: hypothetical protein PYX00_001334 [Menopon gallinae]|uniref:Uncharacterized protein n=1 Tax=Menopon gallinae TaxID=328185 RepID=A0AAW2IDN1_9NEOP